MSSSHFENLDAASHVAKKRIEGMLIHAEMHGVEIPGHLSAAADSLRESALFFGLLWTFMTLFLFPSEISKAIYLSFALALLIWKTGRSALLGWSRLGRLHRLIEEERYEVEHHREQEKEELKELYRLKGFEGKLLDEVIDVLSADSDRLLKVMLEEELGLTLEACQHPLKQAMGASLGVIVAFLLGAFFFWLFPKWGLGIGSLLSLSAGAIISAIYEKNRVISSVIWNLGIGIVALASIYFIIDYLLPGF